MQSLSSNDPQANIDLVIELAHKCFPDNIIVADLTACQAILEAGLEHEPPSELALRYNNLFGIKGSGTAGSITLPTHEYINGDAIVTYQNFATNKSLEDSFLQHADLLSLGRYQNLFHCDNFEEAAEYLKNDGYATDPTYPAKLEALYHKYILG